jgi:hypothetical protein
LNFEIDFEIFVVGIESWVVVALHDVLEKYG